METNTDLDQVNEVHKANYISPRKLSAMLLGLIAAVGVVGYGVYAWQQRQIVSLNKQVAELSKQVDAQKTPASSATASKPTNDPYAGWKIYSLPEDKTITFKYPSDWTIDTNLHDTATTPYVRYVRIVSPTQYKGTQFMFGFYYSPGKDNTLTGNGCIDAGQGVVSTQSVSVSGKTLYLYTYSSPIADSSTDVAMADSSKCNITVPSGNLKLVGRLGTQAVYGVTLDEWNSRPEVATITKIMKSLKY